MTRHDSDHTSEPIKIGVLYSGKMTERSNGAVVRDLTTDVTETGNVYVVAPVPASVINCPLTTWRIRKSPKSEM